MIVSRLAYLMGVRISTSYAAAFSFPGDLLPEFPLKLKRARGCGGDTLALTYADRAWRVSAFVAAGPNSTLSTGARWVWNGCPG